MAFRNPNVPPGTGYGVLPYQQIYLPGNMNLGSPGQQQQPRPGMSQFMHLRPSFHSGPSQRYPCMQQGMPQKQGSFQPQMFAGQQQQQHGAAIQQQAAFHQQQQQQQTFAGHPQQQVPTHTQTWQQRQHTDQQKRAEEIAKKERYFQEQQRKLKQFGRLSGKAASVDSLSINLDEMFGKGLKKEMGSRQTGDGIRDKTQEQKWEEVEDDGFGDFLQAPATPTNTPETPESGPYIPSGQQAAVGSSQSTPNDEGFGEFLSGPTNGSVDEKKDVKPVDNAKSKPTAQRKKVLSLESMMLDSAELTAPSKSSLASFQKKTHHKMESSTQAHRQQAFASTSKAKPRSSAENVASLFVTTKTPSQIGTGQTEHRQGVNPGSTTGTEGGIDVKGLPAWCMNETNLPLVYRQILEASLRENQIETNLLYPILMLSGLDKPVLGWIWSLANQTIPGQLTRPELYVVLGLIALTQNGQQATIEALHHFKEAPVPILKHKGQSGPQTTQQSFPQTSNRPLATKTGIAEDDDFAPFQNASGNKTSTSSTHQIHARAVSVLTDKHKHSDDDTKQEEFQMDSSLKFPKEGSPGDSSSGRSSPLVWDPNSIYDKLTCRSPESVSSGSLSDRTPGEEEEDDEFHDFKSAPKPSKTSNFPALPSFPSIAPPKSSSSGALSSLTSASAKQVKFAFSGMHSLDSLSRSKGTSQPGEDHQIDLFQMDFEKVFPKVRRKQASTDDFGNFHSGSGSFGSSKAHKVDDDFGEFAQFKHSASESDLMGMQPAEGDKYAVLRDLASEVPQKPDLQESVNTEDDFDDFKQAQPLQEMSTVPPSVNPSNSLADFTNTVQQTPGFVANFEDSYPSVQPPAPSSIFEPSPILPRINLSPSLMEDHDFANFKQAVPPIPENLPSLKSDSASTSSSEDKYSIFRVLGSADDREQPDDFGDFQTNPPVMDSLSLGSFGGKHGEENILGEMKKPVSASDLYGMEFDALGSVNSGSVAMLNLEDNFENEASDEIIPTDPPFPTFSNTFYSHNSKLSHLESIDRLDLKTFDLDLTPGRSVKTQSKDRDDSFGDFSSAPTDENCPVDESSHAMSNETLSPTAALPPGGVSTVPLLPSSTSLIGDRYTEVVGNIDDENRHAKEWQRCLEKCHETVRKANNIFNNISSSAVCSEVIKSSEGAEYLTAVIEIYRVSCRIVTSMNAMGVDTEELQRLQKVIELVWTNLSAFLASSSLMPAAGSFIFKTAVLRPEPTNTERACGVCLLNVDSRSKAFDRSKDSHKLVYGGRQYHATCANLWVNMVDSILPSLPFNRLL